MKFEFILILILRLKQTGSDALAIENGNWEEVAASAAACVNKNEQTKSPDFKTIRAGWEV